MNGQDVESWSMRLGIWRLALVAAAAALAATTPVHAGASRNVSQRYVHTGATVCLDAVPVSLGTDVGGACWAIAPIETSVQVRVDDAATRDDTVPVHYTFRSRASAADDVHVLAEGSFCGSATLAVPPGAGRLVVAPFDPGSRAVLHAEADPCFGAPTTGTIYASFS